MRHSKTEEFLAVDVGSANIGVARGSGLAKIAQPLKSLPAKDAIAELSVLASESYAAGIVVGLPRSLNGDDTAQTKYVRDWAANAITEIQLPFYWQDEALSTKQAQEFKTQAGEHAAAAAVILQDFLDTPEKDRVRI